MFTTTASYEANFPPLPKRRIRKPNEAEVPVTSDTEDSASPPTTDNEVQDKPKVPVVSVYKGKDINKAKQLCIKDSNGYEFLFYRSEMNETKTQKTTIYKCVADRCPCEMKMTTSSAKRATEIVVEKYGDHKQVGETVEHLPLPSKHFRWGSDQTQFMR